MDVSICVLTHNRADQVVKTIRNIRAELGETVEVLVLNNGSTDETNEKLSSCFANAKNIKIFTSDGNLGVSDGRRYLWELATKKYILSLDDDIFFSASDLKSMLSSFSDDFTIGVVSPNIKDSRTGVVINKHPRKGLPTFYEACFLIPREVVGRLGGFDSRLMYAGEGMDYAIRMQKMGLRVERDTRATVIHFDRERNGAEQALLRQRWLWSFCFVYWKNLRIDVAFYWSLRSLAAHIKTGLPQHGLGYVFSLPLIAISGALKGYGTRS